MELIEIDVSKALEGMRRAVKEKGEDFVYNPSGNLANCVYERDGACSCIVGHALFYAGVTIEQLRMLDIASEGRPIAAGSLYSDPAASFLDIDHATAQVFQEAQSAQDQGETWGEALRAAERAAGRLVASPDF